MSWVERVEKVDSQPTARMREGYRKEVGRNSTLSTLHTLRIRERRALHLDRIREVAATDDQDRTGEAA